MNESIKLLKKMVQNLNRMIKKNHNKIMIPDS